MTRLPTLVDYAEAVANPRTAFGDARLASATFHSSGWGPIVATGGFALTFEAQTAGGRIAVRCFHKHAEHLGTRYTAIARFVRSTPKTFLAGVEYTERGIRVQGAMYPIVVMDWVDGDRLDAWLDNGGVFDMAGLERVREGVAQAASNLQSRGVAHGDLQHGNIMVRPGCTVTLIDNDGMYVPELEPLGPSEMGHPNYQHPQRGKRFDSSLDVFSAAVIDLSLRALRERPSLFSTYSQGENLIFTARDFESPAGSSIFRELLAMPQLMAATERLQGACTASYADAIDILSDGRSHVRRERIEFSSAAVSAVESGAISATDGLALAARIGDEVTVIGKVAHVHVGVDRNKRSYAFLNFGSRSFTIVCWPRVLAELAEHVPAENLKGAWVRTTGALSEHESTPQIELRRASQLHFLDEARARDLLAASSGGLHRIADRTSRLGTVASHRHRKKAAPVAQTFTEDLEAFINRPSERDAASLSRSDPPLPGLGAAKNEAAPTSPGPSSAPSAPSSEAHAMPGDRGWWEKVVDWFKG